MKRASLSDEQRQALLDEPTGIEVEDPETQKVYILTDADLHREAMQALARQNDQNAIATGIADMEAGRVESFEDVDARIRAKLGLAQPSS